MRDKKREQDMKIRRLISKHEHWKSQWKESFGGFSRVMISPRGKHYNFNGYSFEVEKHMRKTVDAIRKVLTVDAEVTP